MERATRSVCVLWSILENARPIDYSSSPAAVLVLPQTSTKAFCCIDVLPEFTCQPIDLIPHMFQVFDIRNVRPMSATAQL
jgi:hypothetical protein